MKKKLVLFSALLTLAAFATITGCKRDDDDYYDYYTGDASFWSNDRNEDVRVTVDNTYTEYITDNYEPFNCYSNGTANFTLSEGRHYYQARGLSSNRTWSGDFYVDYNGCTLFELYR